MIAMELWLLLIPIGALLVWGLMPAKPLHHELPTPAAVHGAFETLLRQGLDGGRLTIYVRDRPDQRLVFTKYIRAPGDVGMRSSFSPEPNLNDAYEALKNALTQRGIAFSARHVDGKRAIEIDYGRDIGLVDRVAHLVFGEVFKVRLESDCLVFAENVLVRNIPRATGVDA